MRRASLILLAAAALPACQPYRGAVAPPVAARPVAAAPAPAAEFSAHLNVSRFFMLPADPASPMTGASTFGGRCSVPSTWVATFDIEGLVPDLGRVRGNASHCSQITVTSRGVEATYSDGKGWLRDPGGDDLVLRYGRGVGWPADATGTSPWRDYWEVTGGTGRLAGASGSGVDSGTVNMQTMVIPPYLMKGTLTLDPNARQANPFRGTMRAEWSMPYVVSGDMTGDPCARERGQGWATCTITGDGHASPIGPFTISASYCMHTVTGEMTEVREVATTRDGTLDFAIAEQWFDLPMVAPGLDRAYTYRNHVRMTGRTGALAGARGEFWVVGTMHAQWLAGAPQPIPALPWKMVGELSGWLQPAGR